MLQLNNISKSFSSGRERNIIVLENISFEINEKDFIILLGANGVGKSTILRIISGELMPDSGSIIFENKNITTEPSYKRAKFIAKISQLRENNLPSTLTISEVLSLAKSTNIGLFSFLNSKKQKNAIFNLLQSFRPELIDQINEQIMVLSGGEHQIISLITAFQLIKGFQSKNKLLLLDEHISNLDNNTANSVMEATNKLINENSLTSLMVTHNLEIASNYGNRVIILKDKKIAYDKTFEFGKPKNINEFYDIIYN
jgi:putative tryptophan/tyrosine transport system ATP-binding protein